MTSRRASAWPSLVAGVAALKMVVGAVALALALAGLAGAWSPWHLLFAAHVVAYGASAAVLLAGGRRDVRARLLGVVLLLVASVFADTLLSTQRASPSALLEVARGVMALQVDAFTPYFLWRFVREFPVVAESARVERRLALAIRASLAVGVVLFAANVLLRLGDVVPALLPWVGALRPLTRSGVGPAYWALQFSLTVPAFPALVWKSRYAPLAERRRVALLVAAIVAGTAPLVLWVLGSSLFRAVAVWLPLGVAGWVLYPAMLSTPVATAYAVLVRQALDVALVVRRALQYALARWTVVALSAVPVVLLVASVWRRRDESVAALLSTPGQLALIAVAAVGVLTLRRRGRVLSYVDRRFFREQYDARVILAQLVERCRLARDHAELAAVMRGEIDRALHLEAVSVLFIDPVANAFVSPADEVRPLPADSALARAIAAGGGLLDVDLEHPGSSLRSVPRDELHWVADGAFRLLLPLHDPAHAMVALVALGARKSELPFSHEDTALLRAVAAAAELTLAFHGVRLRSVVDDDRAAMAFVAEEPASECPACGVVQPADAAYCARCGAATEECVLPQVVGGKFLVDERAGAGGMGVVYRAMDVQLGRPVALKTLPRVSPDEAMRLRREARVAASVSHPNLALIFGVETWHGRPMLVFEYLPGGTLADRLRAGPLDAREVLDVGVAIASALAVIHAVGVLHRDIKPSNIGFAADGTPKLLDFGLARLLGAMSAAPAERGAVRELPASVSHPDPSGAFTLTESGICGTPLYMSPEALSGELPDPSFDLWSLALVLYEAIAGRNPLAGTAIAERIAGEVVVPDLRALAPGASEALARLFARALADRRDQRPGSATELLALLHAARDGIATGAPGAPGAAHAVAGR